MIRVISFWALFAIGQATFAADTVLPLAGTWRFQLDRSDVGVGERWFELALPDTIQLPGGLTEQGVGNAVTVDTQWTGGIVDRSWFTVLEFAPYRQPDNVKIPFWLQPELYYVGAAWFQRERRRNPAWLAGQGGGAFSQTCALLGDATVGGRQVHRLQHGAGYAARIRSRSTDSRET